MSAQPINPEILKQPTEIGREKKNVSLPERLEGTKRRFGRTKDGLERRLTMLQKQAPEIVQPEVIEFQEQVRRLGQLEQQATNSLESSLTKATPRPDLTAVPSTLDGSTNEAEGNQSEIEDEFHNDSITILKPLKEIKMKDPYGNEKNITSEIEDLFDYLSRTGRLEWQSDRVTKLQAISDKMTDGTDIQTRIVIINKGMGDSAFVTPEGTIFISQAILNKLPTLDRVAGVIAHEIAHLTNKTAQNAFSAKNGKFGVEWLHEAVGDSNAPLLLEKAGLNSMGLSLAIKEISGGQRGSVHQTGISRASQNVMQHGAVDYTTSDQPEQLLTSEFKVNEIVKTNKELMHDRFKNREVVSIDDIKKLHPQDLHSLFEELTGVVPKVVDVEIREYYKDVVKSFHEVIQSRLQEKGYTDLQTKLFFFSLYPVDFPIVLVDTPNELVELAGETVPFHNNNLLNELYPLIFDQKSPEYAVNINSFLSHIHYNHYDIDRMPDGSGIPVTQTTLLDALQIISKAYYYDFKHDHYSPQAVEQGKHRNIERILYAYLFKLKEQQKINPEEMRAFLMDAKERDFNIVVDNLDIEFADQEIIHIFRDVFNQEKQKRESLDELLDKFFDNFQDKYEGGGYDFEPYFSDFLGRFRNTLNYEKIPDDKRLEYIMKFYKRLGTFPLDTIMDLRSMLEDRALGKWGSNSMDKEFNRKVILYNLSSIAGLHFFVQDGKEFYNYMTMLMEDSGLDGEQLTINQLANLNQSIFSHIDSMWSEEVMLLSNRDPKGLRLEKENVKITDFESLSRLPFMQALIAKDKPTFATLKELNEYRKEETRKRFSMGGSTQDLFSEDLFVLMVDGTLKTSFQKIVEKGIPESQYQDLFDFINTSYPAGPEKDQFLREINRRYLLSSEVSLQQKTEYLKKHFDRVGFEGMMMVAEQIDELAVYKEFRTQMKGHMEKYLAGSSSVEKVAIGDFLTSSVTNNFENLFVTAQTDKQAKVKTTEDLLYKWYNAYFNYGGTAVKYDKETGKMALSAAGRKTFRTFGDLVKTLHDLTPLQRAAIAYKALADKGGGLTSDTNRTRLGYLLLKGLDIQSSFVRDSIQKMVETAPSEYLTFPTSQMMAPMLFRSVDINSADVNKLYLEHVTPSQQAEITNDTLGRIVKWDTRSVTSFGARFIKQPESYFLRKANESNSEYMIITHHLRSMLLKGKADDESIEKKPRVDESTEAVIKGVEAMGALGVRSLQLARGAKRFSPELDARLAESFDANPGLEKLRFWENLVKLSEGDEETRNFVENRIVNIGDKLGGGSLFTTYRATLRTDDGKVTKSVVKMLNPNALLFVGKTYGATHQVLQSITDAETSSAEDRRYAQMGTMLVDLSNEWCVRDINDPFFKQDDALFRQTIARFNQKQGNTAVYAPELEFNSMKLKSEAEAENVTLNKYLNNPKIDMTKKKQAVEMLGKFFVHQLRDTPVVDEHGSVYRLAHSDPHVGNYMIAEKEDGMKMAVIDRSMYLRLNDEDIAITEALLRGDNTRFVNGFIQRVCEKNQWKGAQKYRFMATVFKDVLSEYAKQTVTRTDDKFALLRIISEKVEKAGQTIPLEMRLMVRNVNALQQLMSEYGVSYNDIVK